MQLLLEKGTDMDAKDKRTVSGVTRGLSRGFQTSGCTRLRVEQRAFRGMWHLVSGNWVWIGRNWKVGLLQVKMLIWEIDGRLLCYAE